MYQKDQEIIKKIVAGDRDAFDSFYDSFFQKVYNYIYMLVKDHQVTEELTEETFLSCFESLDRFEGRSSLLSWIYGITINTVHGCELTEESRIEQCFSELLNS